MNVVYDTTTTDDDEEDDNNNNSKHQHKTRATLARYEALCDRVAVVAGVVLVAVTVLSREDSDVVGVGSIAFPVQAGFPNDRIEHEIDAFFLPY
jgi:hypothetical protein